jgi:hypothetical protein
VFADVFGQEAHYKITVFLQEGVFLPVTPIGIRVG